MRATSSFCLLRLLLASYSHQRYGDDSKDVMRTDDGPLCIEGGGFFAAGPEGASSKRSKKPTFSSSDDGMRGLVE